MISPEPAAPSPALPEPDQTGDAANRRQILERALDRLQADADDIPPERNARRSVRAPFRRSGVSLRLLDERVKSKERFVLTLDLSAGGIGVLTDAPLAIGVLVDLRLPLRDGTGADAVVGKVMRCEHVAGPVHRVGISFTRPITPRRYLDPAVVVSIVKRLSDPPPD